MEQNPQNSAKLNLGPVISLLNRWVNFISVVLDPWAFVLIAVSLGIGWYSIKTADKEISTLLTILLGLVTGVLGGVFSNKWAQLTETKVFVARGRSAVWSLKLILSHLQKIEARVSRYITSLDEANDAYVSNKLMFEEIIDKNQMLQEEIMMSIDNWTDIVPELQKLKTEMEQISEMKTNLQKQEVELVELRKTLQENADQNTKEKDALQKKIAKKTEELEQTRTKLKEAQSKVTSGFPTLTSGSLQIGTLSGISNLGYSSLGENSTCKNCGGYMGLSLGNQDGLCFKCRPGINFQVPGVKS